MSQHFNVEGFQEFETKVSELEKTGKQIYVLFSGSKNGSDKSWCSDCVTGNSSLFISQPVFTKFISVFFLI